MVTDLAKQLENARLQVKNETPIFSIIEPISIPVTNYKPNRPMIVFIWMFFGGFIGIGLVLGKEYMRKVSEKWKEV